MFTKQGLFIALPISAAISRHALPWRTQNARVSSSGEERVLTETDFVYNEEYDCYDVDVTFDEIFDSVTLYVMANPNYLGVSDIQDYTGNLRKLFEVTITV